MFERRNPVADAFAAIYLAEPKAQLAAIAAERAKVEDAITLAERQRDEAVAEINRRRAESVDADRVAAALLAGDVIDVDTEDTLRQRVDAIRAGIGELNARLRDLDRQRDDVRQQVVNAIAAASAPLADKLAERAIAAIGELVAVLADARAVRAASQNAAAADVEWQLRDPLEQLASRFRVPGWRDQPPAPEIVRAFAPAADAIRLARLSLPG